jgi:hypothetical protein
VACVLVAILIAPGSVVAQSDPLSDINDLSLVDEAFETQSQRLENTGVYVEVLRGLAMPGLAAMGVDARCSAACIAYQVREVLSPGLSGPGVGMFVARVLSMLEVYELAGLGMSADMMQQLSGGMMLAQALMNSGGAGVVPPLPDDYMNPFQMFGNASDMLDEGAEARREAAASLATSTEQAQEQANQVGRVRDQLRKTGVQDGMLGPMTCFRAEDLAMPMETGDEQTATMTAAGLCIDNDEHVIVEHRVEGTMVAEGESRPFFIEVENSDFRQVPGCELYEPYRRTMRMGGMMNAEQMAEMEEAREQLAEFEAQLAAMSPQERAMMEGMIGGQIDMVRNMANGGAIEHVQEIEEILCDPDLAALYGGGAGPGYDLAQIQRNLMALGYQPGNTDGVMDTLTEIAISQYQAERSLPVTGQPSIDLQLMLANEVQGQG